MELNETILRYAVPAYLLLVVAETWYMVKEHKEHQLPKDAASSLLVGIGAGLSNSIAQSFFFIIYYELYSLRIFTLPVGVWWSWIIVLLADDFIFYWFHRLSHQVRFLWASHSVHHSSNYYSLATALRIPWTGTYTKLAFWACLPILGIDPGMMMITKSISVVYQFWLHTATINKLPKWFSAIFTTPAIHRIHHANNVPYLDKNHGGIFIFWDKLLGTYAKQTVVPIYGLTTPIKTNNPFYIAFHEWKNLYTDLKKSRSGKDFFHYLFNAPGWSHDGTSKTAKQLQEEARSFREQ